MKDIFWKETYKNDKVSTFGNPSGEVKLICDELDENSDILDMGCGDGRHSIFLAEKGYNVDAFDISTDAISKINRISAESNIKINTYVKSVDEFEFKKKYDLIISHGLFQFISKEIRDDTIRKMKENTKDGGYNIIAVFTDSIELPEDLKPYLIGVFKEGEIKNYYNDWQIQSFETYIFEDEHEGGIRHKHAINKIVAKKS